MAGDTYATTGILCRAQASATPLEKISVVHKETSTSAATILVTFAALSTVAAEISERAIPPIFPVLTYSSSRTFSVISIGVFLSTGIRRQYCSNA